MQDEDEMANLAQKADWLNAAREDEDLRTAARYLVRAGYANVDEIIMRRLEPLPDVAPDVAARLLRDAVNAKSLALRLSIQEDGLADVELKGGDPWMSLTKAALDRTPSRRYRTCAHCGDAFSTVRPRTLYCSERCRSAAYKLRKLKPAETHCTAAH